MGDAHGAPASQSLLLGYEHRDTASNIINGKTLATNRPLATIAKRYADAKGITWYEALGELFDLVDESELALEAVA
jgi:hypothetical protein